MKKIYQDLTFYLVIFILSYFIYIFPFEILSNLLFSYNIPKRDSFLFTSLIGCSIIFYFKSKKNFYPLKLFVHEGMGIGFISFCTINSLLLINFLINFSNLLLGNISVIFICSISIYGLLNGRLIKEKKITILNEKINNNINFIFISDVHLGSNKIEHLKKILKLISKFNYDFILIGGDLIDSDSFDVSQLNILKKIKKPIYYVSGNHEYYLSDFKDKIDSLNKFNINFLNNKNIHYKEINIIGIDDNQTIENQLITSNRLFDSNFFNIILVHKPSIWSLNYNKNDLMISGHTHNGQIFPFNFLVKLQFKYIYGFYKNDNSHLYVSSGSACWGPKIRLGSNNEIIFFELKSR